MSTTGERIKKLRIEHDLSMQELADRVGVAKSTVFRWENGETPLEAAGNARVTRLADVLGTSVPYLKGQTDDQRASAPVLHLSPDYMIQNGSTIVQIEHKQPKTENSDRLLLYALDILAMQNGFRIDYTPEGDVFLVNREGFRRQITEQDLLNTSDDISKLAWMSFRRLMGGES